MSLAFIFGSVRRMSCASRNGQMRSGNILPMMCVNAAQNDVWWADGAMIGNRAGMTDATAMLQRRV